MICDKIENAGLYKGISSRLAAGLEALGNGSLIQKADGQHELDGDALSASVQHYATKPAEKCILEGHRRYIDVHYIVSGEELIRHAYKDELEVHKPYDEKTDSALYGHEGSVSAVRLRAGTFGIFFPHDAHQPRLQTGQPSDVHKIVLKVRVDEL